MPFGFAVEPLTCRGCRAGARRPAARPGTRRRRPRRRVVPPEVAALLHRAVGAGVLDDDDRLEVLEVAHLLVDLLLDRRGLALAPRAVDRDQRLGLGELHALLDRGRREAAEDDVVRGADARAGEHRHDDLGDHRQEDPDHVARADPAVLQRVGELLDVAVQVRVRDVALLALLAAPVERDAVAVAGLHVAVEAVVGDVELAADEPLGERRVGLVEHLVPLLGPVQRLGLLGPERPRVAAAFSWIDSSEIDRVLGELLGGEKVSWSSSSSSWASSVVASAMRASPLGSDAISGRRSCRRRAARCRARLARAVRPADVAPARRPGRSPSARTARGTCARRRARG